MTDAQIADAHGQVKAIEVAAKAATGSPQEQTAGLAVARQAVALRKELEQWIVMRAVAVPRGE